MAILLIFYICSGVLLIVLSIPLILRKIKPNGLYGFRVRQTMENPDLWYEVNAYAGVRLLVVGAGVVLAPIVLYFLPGMTVDVFALSSLAIAALIFGVGLAQSIRYLRRLGSGKPSR